MAKWYQQSISDVASKIETDVGEGLTSSQAEQRLQEIGPNELEDKGVKSPWAILWEQLTDVMVIILIAAAVISGFIGEVQDTVVIIAIVILNAILGFTQEYRAEQAIAALKQMAVPEVKVRRNGRISEVSSRDLVPGDVMLLEAGNLIAADGRVSEETNLRVEEAALTGESEPVEKMEEPIEGEDVSIGDRKNMVFRGTSVVYGRGEVLVTETGMKTEIGNIATLLQEVERDQTPLQRRLDDLGKKLALAALGIIVLVIIVGFFTSAEVTQILSEQGFTLALFNSEDVQELLLTAISMAVAAVPEGLPAVVTIALALGSQRMLKREALIRKLPAVETLGSVTTICSDKTGTLTQNQMTVTVVDVAGERKDLKALVEGGRRVPVAEADASADVEPPVRSISLLIRAAALCNDAVLEDNEEGEGHEAIGDPTETALIWAAHEIGLHKYELDERWPRVAEVPFSSERKRMTTVHETINANGASANGSANGSVNASATGSIDAPWRTTPYVAFTKGAVDSLIEISDSVWVGDKREPMSPELIERIENANKKLAQDGQRVLGVAFRELESEPAESELEGTEEGLTFVGLVGMIDPPREEVKVAVAKCRSAGIRPVMITGDHPLTAQAIAQEIGIAGGERVITGRELAKMSESELDEVTGEVSVYARVSPEHKLRIVESLQGKGQIVAMTGDGVNDAPALKRSDIGVAMGITGTDVSKEASDMVLLDDNFATIVRSVEEGRTIYDNIRKFIKYTLSSNTGELFVMLVGPLLGMPLPLIPIQILWINLVTDGVPGLALAVEKSERGIMDRPPINPKESIFARGLARQIIWVGLLMGVISLGVGYWGYITGHDAATWRTMVFTTLTLAQMGNALAIRSNNDSLFRIGLFSNPIMVAAVAVTFALQMALIYVPFLQGIFRTAPLPPLELAISLIVSLSVFAAVEISKIFKRPAGERQQTEATA